MVCEKGKKREKSSYLTMPNYEDFIADNRWIFEVI